MISGDLQHYRLNAQRLYVLLILHFVIASYFKIMVLKLEFGDWLDKYFDKDSDHSYYTWIYTDDGMHPNDKTRWKDDDLLNEYERYVNNDEDSHVGLDEYDE